MLNMQQLFLINRMYLYEQGYMSLWALGYYGF